MAPKIEPIGSPREVGEGPFWDSESQSLYFVDVYGHTLNRYDDKTKTHYSASTEGYCASITKVKGEKNKFIITKDNDIQLITWDGVSNKVEKFEHLLNIENNDAGTKLNDAKVDAKGRLWIGTISPARNISKMDFEEGKGSLYRIDADKTITRQFAATIPNGMAFSIDNTKFYYIDSLKYQVDSYDYDCESGKLSNEKTIFNLKSNNIEGIPDGMAIDMEGKLWVAVFGSGMVLRIDPLNGKLLTSITFPTKQISSVCFGGPNLDQLYVTSAKLGLTDEQLIENPLAGMCFLVTDLGVKGFPSREITLKN